MNLGEAALRYAQAGVPVFPLAPGGKVPLTAQGVYAATTDLEEIQAWWTRTPAANIGMPTGEYSGWDVLDVDVPAKQSARGRQRPSGWDALEPILNAGGIPHPVMTIRTPSGGAHLYYAALDGARNGSMSRYGLDYRAQGGYVVVPPSRTDAGAYEIMHGPDPQRRDHQCDFRRLRQLVEKTEERLRSTPRVVLPGTGRARPERRVEALANKVATAPEGARNNMLYWAARVAVEENLGGLGHLFDAARQAGLSAEEASRTIQSALRGPANRPTLSAPGTDIPALTL